MAAVGGEVKGLASLILFLLELNKKEKKRRKK